MSGQQAAADGMASGAPGDDPPVPKKVHKSKRKKSEKSTKKSSKIGKISHSKQSDQGHKKAVKSKSAGETSSAEIIEKTGERQNIPQQSEAPEAVVDSISAVIPTAAVKTSSTDDCKPAENIAETEKKSQIDPVVVDLTEIATPTDVAAPTDVAVSIGDATPTTVTVATIAAVAKAAADSTDMADQGAEGAYAAGVAKPAQLGDPTDVANATHVAEATGGADSTEVVKTQ